MSSGASSVSKKRSAWATLEIAVRDNEKQSHQNEKHLGQKEKFAY